MDKYISLRAFLITSGILSGVIVLTIVLIALNGEDTRTALENRFSRQDVRIVFKDSQTKESSQRQDKLRLPVPTSQRSNNKQEQNQSSQLSGSIQTPPVQGLHRKGPKGNTLPVIRADGMTPFKAYSKPFASKKEHSEIGLVLVDFGLSKRATNALIDKMPANVTFAMSPYAKTPQKTVKKAIKAGFETWLSVPMQTIDFPQSDTGPDTLLTRVTMEANRFRLYNVMGAAAGYPGIIVTDTAQFLQSKSNVNNIIGQMKQRGLGFAFAQTKSTPVVVSAILERDLPVVQNDIWLDRTPTPSHIRKQLAKLEQKAKSSGRAIGFFHPYPSSRQEIRKWAKSLPDKNIRIAPLSYFARN
jgi:hypothetical protein